MTEELTRYRPSQNLTGFANEFSRLLNSPLFDLARDFSTVETSQWVPAVDIREDNEHFIVEADVPGVKPEDIEVTMDNGVLSIRGERTSESASEEGGVRRRERSHGVFYRRFTLPETADPEAVKARGEQGVLRIEIGKRENARSRRIPVER
ncbi:Hsp20/alpha crystallin family protein [Arhodomonas sp. AD133]|uniref:Hsp20/alpha crystallin family protein n=1 Tax=Arhodomonas sp. AD133 TaxID=3415009 RepID=UPI003EBBCD3A